MIKREEYLNQLISCMWNGDVKVVTGIRRCGKSTLLFEIFYEYLISKGVNSQNIIKLELDQRKFYKYRNPMVLCDYVENFLKGKGTEKFFLFIDEVQFTVKVKTDDGFEVSIYDMLNELKSYKNLDVYVTGSNSKMLSKDILTEFRGRATQIHVYPLSFAEVYSYWGGDKKTLLDQYMLYGGMPRIAFMKSDREKKSYLTQLYNEIFIKDILERNRLEKKELLNNILDYLASQIGSLTNPTNIANALVSLHNEKTNRTQVSDYINCIMDSFLVEQVKRYDVKGKSYFEYPYKYYYTDIGLRNARLNYRQFDSGHIMENMVYNELVKRGYSVDVGVVIDRKNGSRTPREIDFVVNDGDRRIYIQSAFQMADAQKTETELQSLKLTQDFFKKVVIRLDIPHHFYDDNGFFHCNLIEFLLGEVDVF